MAGGSGTLDRQVLQRWLFCNVKFLQGVMTSQPVASCQAATLLVYSDSEALPVIASPEFQSQWRALARKCPWGTALQTPEFACTWYQCYEEVYRPLILVRYAAAERWTDSWLWLRNGPAANSLLPERTKPSTTFGWPCPASRHSSSRLCASCSNLAFSSLTFTYLPPGTPLEWLQAGWNRRSTIRAVRRPLLAVDNIEAVRDSLNKKKNRRRLEKLQADGPLSFLELHTPDELDAYYDEIIDFCDFRTGAVHGSCPFREDPRKRAFYRALMAQEGLLHVTVMTLGQRLVAAHIGIRNKSEVMLGIVGHSPFLAEHSPGKLHILQLRIIASSRKDTPA